MDNSLLPPPYINGKMVDYCLAIDPSWTPAFTTGTRTSTETTAAQKIESVKILQPFYSINHTDYRPLLESPIALSIEIKRPGGNNEEAQRQLGIWQYAQWNMLRRLLVSTRRDGDPPLTLEPSLEGLDFLPGVYVVGHQWWFAATTRNENGRVTQWIIVHLAIPRASTAFIALFGGSVV